MQKQLWNWVMRGGQKSFEVYTRKSLYCFEWTVKSKSDDSSEREDKSYSIGGQSPVQKSHGSRTTPEYQISRATGIQFQVRRIPMCDVCSKANGIEMPQYVQKIEPLPKRGKHQVKDYI